MSEIIRAIESEQLKKDLPKFNVGDTLRVMVKVVEGDRERLQAFEGICIAKRNGSIRETFTLRRVSYGIGVERTFPLHSRVLIRLRCSVAAKSVVRSSTICVICPARPPRLRRSNCAVKTAGRCVRRSFSIIIRAKRNWTGAKRRGESEGLVPQTGFGAVAPRRYYERRRDAPRR